MGGYKATVGRFKGLTIKLNCETSLTARQVNVNTHQI